MYISKIQPGEARVQAAGKEMLSTLSPRRREKKEELSRNRPEELGSESKE